jgi:hypothetical protein
MARQRYSIREALNRFLRHWQGTAVPSDEPGSLSGEILSEDEAWSDIAELFGDSLPNQTPTIPDSVRASAAEAIAGTNDTKAVTPLALASAISAEAHEFGEIYTSTGTITDVIGTTAAKITGAYQNNGLSSDNVTVDQANDRITINNAGTYFVAAQVAFSGTASTTYTIQLYLDSVAQPQLVTIRRLNAAGDVGSCSVLGSISVTGTILLMVQLKIF